MGKVTICGGAGCCGTSSRFWAELLYWGGEQEAATTSISTLLRYVIQILGSVGLMVHLSWRLSTCMAIAVPLVAAITGKDIQGWCAHLQVACESLLPGSLTRSSCCWSPLPVVYARFTKRVRKQFQDALAEASGQAEESLGNMRTVRSFTGEGRAARAYEACLGKTLHLGEGPFPGSLVVGFSGFRAASARPSTSVRSRYYHQAFVLLMIIPLTCFSVFRFGNILANIDVKRTITEMRMCRWDDRRVAAVAGVGGVSRPGGLAGVQPYRAGARVRRHARAARGDVARRTHRFFLRYHADRRRARLRLLRLCTVRAGWAQ
eukprot:1194714-Prorocentrum_minimum.AAC.8